MLYIFDWDGTLVDSAGKIVAAMSRAVAEQGFSACSEASIRHIIGLSLPEAIVQLFPALESDNHRIKALAACYSRHFVNDAHQPALFPAALEVLQQLRQRGHQLAVATGKSRRGLDRELGRTKLSDLFLATRCADETHSKPHPQMILELLAECRFDASDALMIGDTSYDLEMAQRAGVASVAVSYGAHDATGLHEFRPIQVIDRLPELLDLGI